MGAAQVAKAPGDGYTLMVMHQGLAFNASLYADLPYDTLRDLVPIAYIGHAETWDTLDIDGDIMARDAIARYRRGGALLAVASIFRDLDSLREEAAMERAGARGSPVRTAAGA